MRSGARAIFQATLLDPPWHGFADFLERVDEPSTLGAWSYEPVDTKLARSAKPSHLVQLGLYGQMIAGVQGRMPRRLHIELGDGRRESFRAIDFARTLTAARMRYLAFVEELRSGQAVSRPEPCGACSLCSWREHCAEEWCMSDHLSRVAGLGRPQAAKLRAAGIETVAALAELRDSTRVPRMASGTLARLVAQARLQRPREQGGVPSVERLPQEDGRGLAQLPPPDPADLFFDLEGDPLTDGGLDYLWGVHQRDPHTGEPIFTWRWGHDPASERVAFEATVDEIVAHLQAHPNAHVYHYAPYETTALKRLSTLHASREEALDRLLRERRFVDLYSVLRQAIRTSEPDLSLKTMEVFFAPAREDAVKSADQSIVEYKAWQETGDPTLLEGIRQYNQVDCENTEGLRNWLVSLRDGNDNWRSIGPLTPVSDEKSEARAEAEAKAAALVQAIMAGPLPQSNRGRELVAHLTGFHRRADKPAFWAMFDRCDRDPDELIDDGDCLGDIRPALDDEGNWQQPVKRSTEAHYAFPPQDTKLREGMAVLHAPTLQKLGTITSLDTATGLVAVKKGRGGFPESGSLIPEPTVPSGVLVGAVRRVATCWAGGGAPDDDGPRYQALLDLIDRAPPRLNGWEDGALVRPDESFVDAVTLRCLAMDRSVLFIQGPPGTGKTYTSAHAIAGLLAAGKRVGVSSNSHKAINNLLARVEEVCIEREIRFCGVKKASRDNPDSYLGGELITDVDSVRDVLDYGPDLVGGTAWLFAHEDLDQYLDYLFIDEAGQVSLGHLLAMGAAARNLVLVGDQMQLGQPIQGSHPGESGLSALDYLLQGEATVASDRGVLLDTSWRMHPSICGFISEAVYDGRLKAHPDCARQSLDPPPESGLPTQGIRFIAMAHEGCGQRSDAEVDKVVELVRSLLGRPYVNREGETGTLGLANILVVAPYNMQVTTLKAALPTKARVGTVDKFQGQEAEVVIVSMTTSSPEDLPRHVDFFYSKNRLNVAISRARTLALVLANPKLLELDAKSVDHLMLVNTLAWVAEEGM